MEGSTDVPDKSSSDPNLEVNEENSEYSRDSSVTSRSDSDSDCSQSHGNRKNSLDSNSIIDEEEVGQTEVKIKKKYFDKPVTEEEYNDLEEVLTNPTRQEGKELVLNRYDRQRVPIAALSSRTTVVADMKEIIHQLSCDICQDVVESSVMTKKCGHRFCDQCIMLSIMRSSNTCPACRQPLASKRELQQDPRFDGIIDQLIDNRQEIPEFMKVKRQPPPDRCDEDSEPDDCHKDTCKRKRDSGEYCAVECHDKKRRIKNKFDDEEHEYSDKEGASVDYNDSESEDNDYITSAYEDSDSTNESEVDDVEDEENFEEEEEDSGNEIENKSDASSIKSNISNSECDADSVKDVSESLCHVTDNEVNTDNTEENRNTGLSSSGEDEHHEDEADAPNLSINVDDTGSDDNEETQNIIDNSENNSRGAGNHRLRNDDSRFRYVFRDGFEINDIRPYAEICSQLIINHQQHNANLEEEQQVQTLRDRIEDKFQTDLHEYPKAAENASFLNHFKMEIPDKTTQEVVSIRTRKSDLSALEFTSDENDTIFELDNKEDECHSHEKVNSPICETNNEEKDVVEEISDYEADILGDWDDDETILLSEIGTGEDEGRELNIDEERNETTNYNNDEIGPHSNLIQSDTGCKSDETREYCESPKCDNNLEPQEIIASDARVNEDIGVKAGTSKESHIGAYEKDSEGNTISEDGRSSQLSTKEAGEKSTEQTFSVEYKDVILPKCLQENDDWELRQESAYMPKERIEKLLEQECAFEEAQLYRMYQCIDKWNRYEEDTESDIANAESIAQKFTTGSQEQDNPTSSVVKANEINPENVETENPVIDTDQVAHEYDQNNGSSNCGETIENPISTTTAEIIDEMDEQNKSSKVALTTEISSHEQSADEPHDVMENNTSGVYTASKFFEINNSYSIDTIKEDIRNETNNSLENTITISPEVSILEDEVSNDEYTIRTNLINHEPADEILYHDAVKLLKDMRGSTPLARTVLDLLARDFTAEYNLKSDERIEDHKMKCILELDKSLPGETRTSEKPVTDIEKIIVKMSNLTKLEALTKSSVVEQLEYRKYLDDEGKPIKQLRSEEYAIDNEKPPVLIKMSASEENDTTHVNPIGDECLVKSGEPQENPSTECTNSELVDESKPLLNESPENDPECNKIDKSATKDDDQTGEDFDENEYYDDDEEEEGVEDEVDGVSDDFGSVYSESDDSETTFPDPKQEKSLLVPEIPDGILEKYRLQKLEKEKKKFRDRLKATKMANIRITVPQRRHNFVYSNQSTPMGINSNSMIYKQKNQNTPNVHISIVQPPLPLHQLQYNMNLPAKITAIPNMSRSQLSHMAGQSFPQSSSSIQQQPYGIRTPKPDMKEEMKKFENDCKNRVKMEDFNRQYGSLYQGAWPPKNANTPPNRIQSSPMPVMNYGVQMPHLPIQQPRIPQDSFALIKNYQAQQQQQFMQHVQMQRMQALQFGQIPGISHMGMPANMGIQNPPKAVPMSLPNFGLPQAMQMPTQYPTANMGNYMAQKLPTQPHQTLNSQGVQQSRNNVSSQMMGLGQINYMNYPRGAQSSNPMNNVIHPTNSTSQLQNALRVPSPIIPAGPKINKTENVDKLSPNNIVENEVEVELWPTNGYRLKSRTLGHTADTVFCGSSGRSTFFHVVLMLLSRMPGDQASELGSFWALRHEDGQLKKFDLCDTLADAQNFVGCQHIIIFYDDFDKAEETSSDYIVNSEYIK